MSCPLASCSAISLFQYFALVSATSQICRSSVATGRAVHQTLTIASAFVESTVNEVVSKRMVKKQQMQWSKRGTHLLLQNRTKVIEC